MPTEPFEIAFASRRAVRDIPADSQYQVCEAVIEALQRAGWSSDGATPAGWSLVFPVGPPWAEPPPEPIPEEQKRVVTWGFNPLTLNGQPVCYYDQYRERPDPSNPNNVIWVAMGDAPGSLGGLASLLAFQGWLALGSRTIQKWPFDGWRVYDWEFSVPGLEANDADYGGNSDIDGGAWTFIWTKGATWLSPSLGPAGGGYYLKSGTQNNGSLRVWIGIPDSAGNFAPTFIFEASTGGEKPVRTLRDRKRYPGMAGDYKIIANPYQFFIFLKGGSDPFETQLMATMPKFAGAEKGVHYAAVVAGGQSFRTTFQWEAGTAAAALNGGFSRTLAKSNGDYQGAFPGLYMVKFPYPLRTSTGSPVLQQAFIGCPPDGAPRDASGQARIVGRLWDAVIIGEHYPLDSQTLIAGRLFQCIGNEQRYQGSRCSLWIAAEEEGQQ